MEGKIKKKNLVIRLKFICLIYIVTNVSTYFLNYYDILYKNGEQTIDNNTLAALTLLIAESNPKEKDVIIDLVMNFLNSE